MKSPHLVICFERSGRINFYPEGAPAAIEAGLRRVLELLTEKPELVKCAARTCDGSCGHGQLSEVQ